MRSKFDLVLGLHLRGEGDSSLPFPPPLEVSRKTSLFFLLRVMDLISTISQGAMEIIFNLNGWVLTKPFVHNGVAYFKPDFYPDRFIIGVSKKGYIYASGDSRIIYRGQTFTSVSDLINKHTKSVLNDFDQITFIEEKEWVITRDGQEFLYSFTTLDKLPKASKLRC